MYSFITSNEPKDGSQQRDIYLNPAGNANWQLNFLCFCSFPTLLCVCTAPPSAFDTGDWIQKASQLSTQSPLECYEAVDRLNGEIFVVNIASVYQMAKKKDSLRKQNHIINNDT